SRGRALRPPVTWRRTRSRVVHGGTSCWPVDRRQRCYRKLAAGPARSTRALGSCRLGRSTGDRRLVSGHPDLSSDGNLPAPGHPGARTNSLHPARYPDRRARHRSSDGYGVDPALPARRTPGHRLSHIRWRHGASSLDTKAAVSRTYHLVLAYRYDCTHSVDIDGRRLSVV